MNQFKFLAIALALLLPLGAAQAEMYKWVDKDGHTVYSQTPPESGNYQSLSAPSAPPPSSTAPDTSADANSANANGGQTAPDKTVEKLSQQNAEIRKKNCEAAKKNLRAYEISRRIRTPDGKVVRLDDNERQKRIEESKQAVKDYCD